MKLNPLIVFRKELDGTALLFNPENGETFGLNQTSAFIWEQLALKKKKVVILKALGEVTELPPEAERDLAEFLIELKAKGFLEL